MNIENTLATHSQLLAYIATMLIRIQSHQRHLQLRLEILDSIDPQAPTTAMLKEWFSNASASRLAKTELEGFSEQFPELAREAKEHFEMSDKNFHEGLMQEIRNNPISTKNDQDKAA